MLAQNFKTPTDLKITDAEFDALAKLLGMLERGELIYSPWQCPDNPAGFNMGEYEAITDCGTVCCIAGWADRLFGTKFVYRHYDDLTPELDELFGARQVLLKLPGIENITPPQAAIALRNYLTTGNSRWAEAAVE